MKVNIHYAQQIAVGFTWLYFTTYYRLHVTVMLPWISIEIGLFKKHGRQLAGASSILREWSGFVREQANKQKGEGK